MNPKKARYSATDQGVTSQEQTRLQTEKEERRRAEQAVRLSEERCYALIENAQDMICVLDENAVVLYKSPAVERILGYSLEELIGKNAFDMVHPDDLAQTKAFFAHVLQHPGVALTFALRLRHKHDAWHHIEAIFDNLLDHSAIRGVIVNYRDLTERKSVEQQLAQAQKMEGIGRLAGGIAHDFNNLLSAILGYAELAEQEVTADSPLASYLQNIEQAAQRAANLTRQLLAFARRQPIEPRVVNLNDLVTGLTSMLRRLLGEDVELVTLPNAARAQVRVDPGQIEQVLVNLVVNARDAMPDGGILTIETAEVVLETDVLAPGVEILPGSYVLLSVCDTGCGMTPQVQALIFDPFFTTKEVGKGTGLGLSLCYGTVKQSGGYIVVESAPGQGATFQVYLPRVESASDTVLHSDPPTPSRQGNETILLVEDESLVRGVAAQALRAHGYTILEASNGEEALRLVATHEEPIHMLITDVVMPQMGGRILAERLQTMYHDLKVLFVSGYLDEITVRHGVLQTGQHFLDKPFTSKKLLVKVRTVLDG